MAHYVFTYKNIYVSIAISIQIHTYVHRTHNMSIHTFEYSMEIVTLDEGNYREVAHMYINDWCDINT